MREFKRKLYNRGSSYEITIPKAFIFGANLSKKQTIAFKFKKGSWTLDLGKNKNNPKLTRNIYKRGHSYASTIPLEVALNLDPDKEYFTVFQYSNQKWNICFEEIKEVRQ